MWLTVNFFAPVYRKTAVVGAGYIAVELAGILNELGSDTTLFIRHDKVSFDVVFEGKAL